MGRIIRRGVAALLIVTSLLTVAIVGAAVQVFDGTGQHIVDYFESPNIGRQRALQRAELDAKKKAGVYLKAYSRSVNIELTDDEIATIISNTIKINDIHYDIEVIKVSDNTTTMCITATLKATIDTDSIYDWIRRNEKNPN